MSKSEFYETVMSVLEEKTCVNAIKEETMRNAVIEVLKQKRENVYYYWLDLYKGCVWLKEFYFGYDTPNVMFVNGELPQIMLDDLNENNITVCVL